jgi:dCMP deaminase
MSRPTWDEYFLSVMDATTLRASCDRGKSACIITKDNRILATGYVGAPMGIPSCDEVGHLLIRRCEIPVDKWKDNIVDEFIYFDEFIPGKSFSTHCIRTVHAEQNAIVNCARNGVSTLGSTLYCTMTPCPVCTKLIIQAGIIKVIAKNKYQNDLEARTLFDMAKIELVILSEKELY